MMKNEMNEIVFQAQRIESLENYLNHIKDECALIRKAFSMYLKDSGVSSKRRRDSIIDRYKENALFFKQKEGN